MSDTTFTDLVTVIPTTWLNDVNTVSYKSTAGQVLIGTASGSLPTAATLTAGTGVSITNASGSITIALSGAGAETVTTVTATGHTAIAGEVIFADMTSGAYTINLPASPAAGDRVQFIDVAGQFGTNNLTIGANTKKIMGSTNDMLCSTQYVGVILRYSDSTNGWRIA